MSVTGLQMNFSAVSFTPSGGSLTPITKVDGGSINYNVTILKYSGDADIYPTVAVNSMNDPSINIKSSNIGLLQTFVRQYGILSATHNDAKGASGGAIVYSLANAIGGNVQISGEHAQFGTGSIEFSSFSSDGVTSPLSFSRV